MDEADKPKERGFFIVSGVFIVLVATFYAYALAKQSKL